MNKGEIDIEIPAETIHLNNQQNIKTLMEIALNFEKENKIQEAIKSYEKVFLLYDFDKKDNEVFELYMKVGDLCQIRGEIESGLQYFEKAFNIAKALENKILQVDVLLKLADSYISKGEIETSAKYAGEVDNILSSIDYNKGKIENRICLSRIYYIKKDFFKAREICNEVLRLCGDNYPLYKGKILIIQVELYKDITSVEEHLELLNQAYTCFETVNYERGMMGVVNNIAFVYGDKLQDYEKALEYLIKLKDISEKSIYVEFHKISYLNIGEQYYKVFRHKEALVWLEEALKSPIGAYMDNILVYNYSYLILTCLRLSKYKKAYDYYTKAKEEVDKNSSTESTIVQYYKAAALMFIEFGENNKALSYIKIALDSVGKDETMIKWNIGLEYEYIKLKEAKKETEIIDILEGIRYTISKYKNTNEILDSVYDIILELINKNYSELAYNFLEEYNYLISENENIVLKKMYIDIKINEINTNEDLELLECALKLAKQIKNYKIQWNICCCLGDYYIKKSDFKNAKSFYCESYRIVKRIVHSVHKNYRLQFIKSNNLLEPFNKFYSIKFNSWMK